ncbi:MAG: thioredoxin family protein [Acidimicrobiales bacterium]
MDVILLYFEDCPNWQTAEGHLELLALEVPDLRLSRHLVDTAEEAERVGFAGSPSILIDGIDPFAEPNFPAGLSCRMYQSPAGPAGSPTLDQLRKVLSDV